MKDFTVTSPAFENNGLIPEKYTGYGADISPQFHLENIDEKAVSICILMDDMSHPVFPQYNHWVIWNIPVMDTIPENIPHGPNPELIPGALQGKGYGKHRYKGPKPPFKRCHEYAFNFYILDCKLDLSPSSKKRDVIGAMAGHILQYEFISGSYSRKK